ncbi:MAG: DedA family protein [Variovorax sp.]
MADWIIGFLEQHGYLGIAALMMLENIFPPIPSELIMPFAGFVVARGTLDAAGVMAAGVAGSLAGTLPWYWVGQRIGRERVHRWIARHGRWLTVSTEDLDRAERWFERSGRYAVFLGRLVPGVRSVISLPAGLEQMRLAIFLLWSALGTVVWTGMLVALGFFLENHYDRVGRYVSPVSSILLGGFFAVYLWRLLRGYGRSRG